MAGVTIKASFADGSTIQKFGEIIQERMKWMRGTARDSIAACAITALKSIRTITKVAKASGIKVDVKPDASLFPSYTTHGGHKRPCLRYRGSRQRYVGDSKVAFADILTDIGNWQVYSFLDTNSKNKSQYLIVAPSMQMAKRKAKDIVRRRQIRYAGLARRAIGILMQKTSTKTKVNDKVPMNVTALAKTVTYKRELIAKSNDGNGGKYALALLDDLRYALDAIRGGKASVDMQMKKAMNKIVSVINRKIPDGNTFFSQRKLATPFPEVTSRRKQ